MNSNLILDFGYTGGYKENSTNKQTGDKSHFFSNFSKKFKFSDSKEGNLELNVQTVSNKKYLKLYRIKSNLIENYETSSLKNFINYEYFDDDKDQFISFYSSIHTDLSDNYNDKYEYIFPEINFNKNLYSGNLGYGSFNTNLKVRNYDTNKHEKYLINEFEWGLDKSFGKIPYNGKFLTNIKNVNYETTNVKIFKDNTTHELFGAIGYLASLNLIKEILVKF